MKVRNSDYKKDVEAIFTDAPFIKNLGIRLIEVEPGKCKAEVELTSGHLQHLGRVHGGVASSLAGHSALGAALSIVPAGDILVAPEFTFKMFRSAEMGILQARAHVIKSGALLVFAESEVFHLDGDVSHLVAKGAFTFTRVKKS